MLKIVMAFLLGIVLVGLLLVMSREEINNPTLDPHLDYRKVLPPPK